MWGSCYVSFQTKGFRSLTPVPSKSAILRVTTVRSWLRAMEAICLSTGFRGDRDISFPQTWAESPSNARIRSPKSLVSIPSQPSKRRHWERSPRLRIISRPWRNSPTAWTGRNIVSFGDLCQNFRTPALALLPFLASLITCESIRYTFSHFDDSCQNSNRVRHRVWRRELPRGIGVLAAGEPP